MTSMLLQVPQYHTYGHFGLIMSDHSETYCSCVHLSHALLTLIAISCQFVWTSHSPLLDSNCRMLGEIVEPVVAETDKIQKDFLVVTVINI